MPPKKPDFAEDDFFEDLERGFDELLQKQPLDPGLPKGGKARFAFQKAVPDISVFPPPVSGQKMIKTNGNGSGERLISAKGSVSDIQKKTPVIEETDLQALIHRLTSEGERPSDMPTGTPPPFPSISGEIAEVLNGTHTALPPPKLPNFGNEEDSPTAAPEIEFTVLRITEIPENEHEIPNLDDLFKPEDSLQNLGKFLDHVVVFYQEMGIDLSTFSVQAILFEWQEKPLTIEETNYVLFYLLKKITDIISSHVFEKIQPEPEKNLENVHGYVQKVLRDISIGFCDKTLAGRFDIIKRHFDRIYLDESLEPLGKVFAQTVTAGAKVMKM